MFFKVYLEKKNIYINTEDNSTSNWIRYIRPAASRELRNVMAITKADTEQIFMITTRDLSPGEELLYWQDDASGANKKKMEKTSNIFFTYITKFILMVLF